MFYEITFNIICLFLAIITHEIGHILAYRHYGLKPNIGFRFGKIEVSHKATFSLQIRQFNNILLSGIVAGFPFILITRNIYIYIFYILISSADILNIISLKSLGTPNEIIIEAQLREVKKTIKDIKNYKNEI